MIQRKKINDMKKTSVGTVVVRTDVSRDNNTQISKNKPHAPVSVLVKKTNTPKPSTTHQLFQPPVTNTTPVTPSSPISFKKVIRRILTVGIIFGIMYSISLLSYHGIIHVTQKNQSGTISDVFTAVPKERFTGGEKKIPYYTYISNISISDETQLLSPDIFGRVRSTLPPDAIVSSEFIFIARSETNQEVIGIIFFKKQDIQNYVRSYLLVKDYDNILHSLKNLSITPVTTENYQEGVMETVPVKVMFDFTASGNKDLQTLSSLVTDKNIFSCHEILQSIPEISVDKCGVFPFWYKKMPQNPKFIRIITK